MGMDLFWRWLMYPLTAIFIELPNMLVIYIIHWQTYRPILKEQQKVEFGDDDSEQHYLEPTVDYEGSSSGFTSSLQDEPHQRPIMLRPKSSKVNFVNLADGDKFFKEEFDHVGGRTSHHSSSQIIVVQDDIIIEEDRETLGRFANSTQETPVTPQ